MVAPSGVPASGAPYTIAGAAAARGDASHLLVGVAGGGGEPPWLSVVPRHGL